MVNAIKKLAVVATVLTISIDAAPPVKADIVSLDSSIPMLLVITEDPAAPIVGTPAINIIDFQAVFDQLMTWDPEFAALAPASSPGPGHDFVAGSQKVTAANRFQHVRVAAHSGPAGEDPHGSVRVTFDVNFNIFGVSGAGDVKGDVTCLSVTGNIARVAALLSEPFNGFTHVLLTIFDNGNPGPTLGQSPDDAFIAFTSTPHPTLCAPFGVTFVGDKTGNFVVNDAP